MTPERWQQIDSLLQAAIERPLTEREALLAEKCSEDKSLRQAVESLLSFQESAEGFLERPALEEAAELFSESQTEFMAGQLIGSYRIERWLGSGGMGEVYLAEDTKLDRKVAIKFLPTYLEEDEFAKKRLIREAKAAAQLDHPNICAVYEVKEVANLGFIVMQYVAGGTLGDRIKSQTLRLSEALDICIQVVEALVEAHSREIIHRDIKPGNIMINTRGQVKVLDFGLAKVVGWAKGEKVDVKRQNLLSRPGERPGTPPYMSPEQAKGDTIDTRSDLFAVGVILYECVAGSRPFSGKTEREILDQVIHLNPSQPSKLNANVPPELDRIVIKALAKNPDGRYQSAGELLEDLRALRDGLQPKPRLIAPDPSTIWATFSKVLLQPPVYLSATGVITGLALLAYFIALPRLYATPYRASPESIHWYDKGTMALRKGAYYEASKALLEAVAADDKFALAHARLAEAYTELDYSDKAKDEIIRAQSLARELSMPQTDALYLRAVTSTVLRDFPAAVESYQQIAHQVPDQEQANVYLDLGRAYEKNDELEKAKASYQEATKLAPQEAAAFLRMGVVCGELQDYGCAAEAFPRAESLYQAHSNLEGVTEVLYQRGFLLLDEVKPPKAREQLENALQLTKATGNLYQEIRILQALSNASALEGYIAKAKEQATEAIQLARDNGIENLVTSGLIWLGNSFLLRGDYDDADAYYQQALQLAQRDKMRVNEAWARRQLGSLRSLQHKTDEALSYIEPAAAFFKERGYRKWFSSSITLLGRSYRNKGDYEAALKTFNELHQLGEQLGDQSQVGMTKIDIGNVLSYEEHYSEALRYFQESYRIFKSLKADFYMAYAAQNGASMLWQLGRSREAKASLDEAASIAEQAARPEDTNKHLLAHIHLTNSLLELSEWHILQSRVSSQKALDLAGDENVDVAIQARLTLALAQARSGARAFSHKTLATRALDMAAATTDPQLLSAALLASAEVSLASGETQRALERALQAQERFALFGKQDSEWRAWLIAAQASRRLGNETAALEYSSYALDRLSELEQKWGSETYKGYLTRPDITYFRKQLDQLFKL